MDPIRRRRSGVILVAVSAILWSTAGLFVRMADLDAWTIVAWRSVFSFLTLGGIAVAQNRHDLVRSFSGFGLPGLVSIVVSVISTIIPICMDHDCCAHSRSPMDVMVSGRATSLFQASQQMPRMSS